MKTQPVVAIIALGFILGGFAQQAFADGGSITLEGVCYVKVKDSKQFGERKINYSEQFCAFTNKAGSGFMHEVSLHGPVWSVSSPSASNLIGHNVIVDKDEDQIYMTIERRGVPPDPGVGHWRITGGTGKYVDVSGSGTYSVHYLPPIVAGSLLNMATLKGQYRIP
jgi:hypothetical protein